LFDAARFYAPTLIILEDIDFIGLNRDFSHNPILGELLTQLDGNDPNDGIFVITTTNRPELLDEALANRPSRFDISCVFELPNSEQRQRIIELFSKDMEFAEPLNMPQIIEVTKDLSGSHIKEIFVHCQLAALKAKRKPTNKDIIAKAENYKKNLIKNGKEMVR
jgi:ATP-dependent 26S proteasome regulatory subunit